MKSNSKIEVIKLKPYLYHARFKTRYDMNSTLVRIVEHYRHPYFKGKPFTLAQYKKWYKSITKKKKFTYYKDWSGFYIASKSLKDFFNNKIIPLSSKEKVFLNLFKETKGRYGIITTFKLNRSEKRAVKHESIHAMFDFDKNYRNDVIKYIKKQDMPELINFLQFQGYDDSVILNEINAYLVSDFDWLIKKGLNKNKYKKHVAKLINIFKRHS